MHMNASSCTWMHTEQALCTGAGEGKERPVCTHLSAGTGDAAKGLCCVFVPAP